MRRALTVLAVAAFLAGCAAAPRAPTAPAPPFDPQALVGRWQGEWRTFSKSGPAILDVPEVKDRRMVGRLYLTGYVAHFTGLTGRETEAAGTVSERDAAREEPGHECHDALGGVPGDGQILEPAAEPRRARPIPAGDERHHGVSGSSRGSAW